MAKEIHMPQLGESVTEGTISKWLVAPGDSVKKYDPIAEVMTDKVNAEVPSSYTGTVQELVASEDETVQVGDLICYMEVEGEAEEEAPVEEKAAQAPAPETDEADSGMKKRYSPAVLKLAQENGINLDHVNGSGRGGRITRKDVESYIASGGAEVAEKTSTTPASQAAEEALVAPAGPTYSTKPAEAVQSEAGDVEIPVSGVRKAIADNMLKSKHEIPHAWTMIEVDVTNLVKLREKHKEAFKARNGYSLTFMPFFIEAVVQGLKKYPRLNSTWAGDKIIQKQAVNMSMAAATEEALYVPVIKHADEQNIQGLARQVQELAGKVRNGTLASSEMQGGTFTINNTGSFGSVQSMPIINHPQAAILSVESIVKRPVIMQDDMIAVRHMVNLCLSLDHRVLDGLVAGQFLQYVKDYLENIDPERSI
ncbi:branched-chain alpha-keto acid dehydrogenase E2 component [Salsuginibacillus halophilus]|uniref:Dihydrolipoamide acetyltransferase component of pyruvate dehydrogenase complex n=1 Tax=Salsuginibacillus halophilus TaxID=517424 RepID=A0A2P8HY00_9BACI|nr:dihydrolipoamide acetyltransferase family protein [Salsuginibacillus halophilus]PSL51108.1 branched-chain alpha-keto acid dehydrogenase E2 component [Salsuginibacillus halophilus]